MCKLQPIIYMHKVTRLLLSSNLSHCCMHPMSLLKIKLITVIVSSDIFNLAIPGVSAAVQSVQSAAEQGLSAAMMKMQVCV